VQALRDVMPAVHFPLLAVHSPDDTLTDSTGSVTLVRLAALADKTFAHAPGMWHDLVNEPGNSAVFRTVLAWLEEHV